MKLKIGIFDLTHLLLVHKRMLLVKFFYNLSKSAAYERRAFPSQSEEHFGFLIDAVEVKST